MLVEKRITEHVSKVREEGRLLFGFKVTGLLLRGGRDGKGVNGEGMDESPGKY